MSDSARYHAMANTAQADSAGMCIDAPHVSLQDDTVMPESLITSIQPHYQVSHAPDLPEYFNYALRVAGPLLALGVNSPFSPPICTMRTRPPTKSFETAGWNTASASSRPSSMTRPRGRKGPLPAFDLADVDEAIDRIATDDTIVPMPVESGERFDDQFPISAANMAPTGGGSGRFSAGRRARPPTPASSSGRSQPSPRSAIPSPSSPPFAGLMESLTRLEHPVVELDWQLARENFYAAMVDGLSADLNWITNDGKETTDCLALYEDLLAHAEDGLTNRGLSEEEAAKYLYPLRRRVRQRVTPASWKREQVQAALEDGDDLAGAIEGMQQRYVARQSETLLEGSFADWIGD